MNRELSTQKTIVKTNASVMMLEAFPPLSNISE